MFRFIKQKKKKEKVENNLNNEVKSISNDTKLDLQDLKNKLLDCSTNDDKAEIYSKIGTIYKNNDQFEEAIDAFEKGLDALPKIGTNYKELLSLYTKMQIKSAINGQVEQEKFYSDKLNNLKNTAKKMVLSK